MWGVEVRECLSRFQTLVSAPGQIEVLYHIGQVTMGMEHFRGRKCHVWLEMSMYWANLTSSVFFAHNMILFSFLPIHLSSDLTNHCKVQIWDSKMVIQTQSLEAYGLGRSKERIWRIMIAEILSPRHRRVYLTQNQGWRLEIMAGSLEASLMQYAKKGASGKGIPGEENVNKEGTERYWGVKAAPVWPKHNRGEWKWGLVGQPRILEFILRAEYMFKAPFYSGHYLLNIPLSLLLYSWTLTYTHTLTFSIIFFEFLD